MTQSAELLQMETGTLLKQEQGRAVFAVKAPDDLVVKVPMNALRAADTGRVRPFLYKHFPTTRHRMLLRQLTHDIEVRIRSHDAGIASPIAFTNGVMRTDMGLGLLMQRVGPEGGGLGMTLDEFVARDLLDTAALKALNDFSRAVFALGVVAPGLNSRSIVWGQQEGKWQPLIVDGFGDPNVIKLRSWVPYLRHRALHRGMERTARDVGLHWSRRKKMFLRNDFDALD